MRRTPTTPRGRNTDHCAGAPERWKAVCHPSHMAVLQGKEGKRLRSARRWCGGRGHTPARPAWPARAGGRGGIPPHSPNLPNSPSSSTRVIEALAQALAAAAARRRQLSPPPRAVAQPKRPAHRRHRPAPIRLRSPGRPVWAARTEPGAPGSRALDAVGVCARHAWHWHGAAGAHCGAAGAMHRVNGRGVRQAHRSRRAVRAAPAPSTLLVAARRPPAGWLGHHLPAGQERALTWQVAAWISSEWAARGARCEGRRRTCCVAKELVEVGPRGFALAKLAPHDAHGPWCARAWRLCARTIESSQTF